MTWASFRFARPPVMDPEFAFSSASFTPYDTYTLAELVSKTRPHGVEQPNGVGCFHRAPRARDHACMVVLLEQVWTSNQRGSRLTRLTSDRVADSGLLNRRKIDIFDPDPS